ncbi:cortical protein marker for cell polarity-domain-containing protein [Protomyces lactucae-debilis]|uniref:Cortical protein marker for cell polarity-domain-containing protein n=1 Tax=Protomyces lactucae-debilis TaxID=2754530 RepID=A0A1Y2FDB8_PROLT|nr:cortical protein marker for cell polarity-domain-containing protein [Protomyces lactucae-debilis]ORY81922.1 cortical protein marker for cell polarity-domain-containing protein [Protomyces lactucae-debilis]
MHYASSLALFSLAFCSTDATAITQPALDISSLGRVVVGGRFSGISLYQDTRQLESLSNASTDSLVLQSPDGYYNNLGTSNGVISAVCAFNSSSTTTSLYIAGNFSQIGSVQASNVARYDAAAGTFAPLSTGVPGPVSALYCDASRNVVYIGGDFNDNANMSNAAAWSTASNSFLDLSFGGFDGPVRAITARDNAILFGGRFDMIDKGTTSISNTSQQVNLQSSYITSENPSSIPGFINPNNILCSSKQDEPGSVWLAADNAPASWSSALNYTIRPTKFRIYNTHRDGRGVREFRFIAKPINGILNLTYTDPTTGSRAYCDARCPLSDSTSVNYTEFEFVNVIQMTGFTIAMSGWYGLSAGLRGFELFTDDINAYAVTAFNAPTCATGTFTSTSQQVGNWISAKLGDDPGFLSTTDNTASVTFFPQISQKGTYSVRLYTPGCLIAGSCASRGQVLVSVYPSPDAQPTNITLFQTNNYEKYDTVFQGTVAASTASFRPRVVLSALGSAGPVQNTVASRVQFIPLSTLEGAESLNGLFEYDPSVSAVSTLNATADQVGRSLGFDAVITQLVTSGNTVYAAGNFSGNGIANVLKLQNNAASSLGNAGTNAAVSALLVYNGILYLGGNFTALVNATTSASHVVAYDTAKDSWQALGSGLDGAVSNLFLLNGTVGCSGTFTSINANGGQAAISTRGSAFWNPSTGTWAASVNNAAGRISTASAAVNGTYLTGSLQASYALAAPGVASLLSSSNGTTRLRSLATNTTTSNFDVQTLNFYNSSTKSITIVGGRFDATDSNGRRITNVALLSADGTVAGLTNNGGLAAASTVFASHVDGDVLYLGGNITGSGASTLGGLALYNLASDSMATTQPAALTGSNVRVQSISTRPGVRQLVVAGSFDAAGALTCPSLCVLDLATTTWQRPGVGLSGNVSQATWIGNSVLLLAGDLSINGSSLSLATFAFDTGSFASVTGSERFPGSANVAVTDTNATSSIYVAGMRADNSSSYLAKWNGSAILDLSTGALGAGSVIYDLQFVELAKRSGGASNNIMAPDRRLLVAGRLNLTGNGTFAAALFDGVAWSPYLLASGTSQAETRSGVIRTIFTEQQATFGKSTGSGLSKGAVIGIALAMALFVVFMIVALGVLVAWWRRRREGYRPANQQMTPAPGSEKRTLTSVTGPSPDYTARPMKT